MAFILSDIHGDDKSLRYFINNTNEKYCIQLGDFGFWFDNEESDPENRKLNKLEEMLEKEDKYIFTILGNHECWPRYYSSPTVEREGAKCWAIRPRILAVQPGEVLVIENKTFLCVGGADSTDWQWRINYKKENGVAIWWVEETISDEEIQNALTNAKRYGGKVNFILTHTPPAFFTYKFYESTYFSESENKLDKLMNECDYDQWFCGHVHEDCTVSGCGKSVTSLGIDKWMMV